MSEYQHLKVEKADGIARITLDRPKHNVLNIEMMNEIITELKVLISEDGL
jgi:enoyl-CoA hydratase/carnithine racemase